MRGKPLVRLSLIGSAALCLVGGVASSAYGQARSVKVTQNGTDTLELAEVQAFQSGTGTNVASQANGGVASATSSAFGTEPGDANDASAAQGFDSGSVWHSGDPGQNQMLTVTFSQDYNIGSVTILGRNDGCCLNRNDNLTVQLLNAAGTPIFTQTGVSLGGPNESATITIPEPSTLAGLAGLAGLGLLARRQRRR
jgi:hypothetical protein